MAILGHWRDVRELDVSILLLDLPELRVEHLHDLCMRKWEVVLDVQHDGPRLLRAICEVTNRVRHGAIRCRCYGMGTDQSLSHSWRRGSMFTSDNDVALAPLEVS